MSREVGGSDDARRGINVRSLFRLVGSHVYNSLKKQV
jgi:hypothetical protein